MEKKTSKEGGEEGETEQGERADGRGQRAEGVQRERSRGLTRKSNSSVLASSIPTLKCCNQTKRERERNSE